MDDDNVDRSLEARRKAFEAAAVASLAGEISPLFTPVYDCVAQLRAEGLDDDFIAMVLSGEAQMLLLGRMMAKLKNPDSAKHQINGGASYEPAPVALLTAPISILDDFITQRVSNCLKNEGCKTIGDVVARTEREWSGVWNLGAHSLRNLKEALAKVGRHLATEIEHR